MADIDSQKTENLAPSHTQSMGKPLIINSVGTKGKLSARQNQEINNLIVLPGPCLLGNNTTFGERHLSIKFSVEPYHRSMATSMETEIVQALQLLERPSLTEENGVMERSGKNDGKT